MRDLFHVAPLFKRRMVSPVILLFLLVFSLFTTLDHPASAYSKKPGKSSSMSPHKKRSKSNSSKKAASSPGRHAGKKVAVSRTKKKAAVARAHDRRSARIAAKSSRGRRLAMRAQKKRPSGAIWSVAMNTTPYAAATSARIKSKFCLGQAGLYTPEDLVRAGVFNHQPLVGGIHKRKAAITNLVIHSTETGRPCDAQCVIKSWNRGGASHPGTQYIVDRDGKIFQTVDPAYATAHVNISRTRKGVSNQNSIGIEIVRAGDQKYTATQLRALVRLVAYIKDRFPIANVYGHGQIQPSNRTDPVAFNWKGFHTDLRYLDASETAYNANAKSRQS